ncbi:unnamed protein product [Euphydryas editha]|uniref:Reverse transcriptase n=1 Tax=Euphydryas editha TaxID=104508 RepID=A0AAU9TNL5_EUPED|nr:unnamed protein product [Euphydryas editha]
MTLNYVKSYVPTREDSLSLQSDLSELSQWCLDNDMVLNINKCKHVRFGRKVRTYETCYFLGGSPLTKCDTISDLGITFDTKLTFVPHIDSISNKASKMLGFVMRNTKKFKHPRTKITLYCAYVRSVLEYGSVIWAPHYTVHQLRLERLQKRFLRYLSYSCYEFGKLASYKHKLKLYKMHSLIDRRHVHDMIFLFKVLRGQIDCPTLLRLFHFRVPSHLPRRPLGLLSAPAARTNLKQNYTVSRLCKNFNALCIFVDIFNDNLTVFKTAVFDQVSNI